MSERQSNFELLRIVAMIMIVLSHCIFYGVLDLDQANEYVLWQEGIQSHKIVSSFSILGTIGVGIFFMLSGYFSSSKKRIGKIIYTTIFYGSLSLVVGFIAYMFGAFRLPKNQLVLISLRTLFIPVTGSVWWFITAYFVLIIFSSQYNSFIEKLNKHGLIIWVFLLLLFGYTLGNLGSNFHDFECAIFFYTLGIYFRKYSQAIKNRTLTYIVFFVIGFIVNGACRYVVFSYELEESVSASMIRTISSMISHLFAEPICVYGLFGLFSKIRIQYRQINMLASHTLGVYLFHEAPFIRIILWQYILDSGFYYSSSLFIPSALLFTIVVFALGVLIDLMKEKLIEGFLIKTGDNIVRKFKEFGYEKNKKQEMIQEGEENVL